MDKVYNPQRIESHWSSYWENHHCFKPQGNGTPYCIMLPPPNVTGTLHMGHGFQQTLMDTLIRFHRMCKDNTLWQGGTDHAGIATQMVVERQLQQAGTDRLTLGREAFVERIWQWRDQSGQTITQQMRRLGLSIDWSCIHFTMDDALIRATREAFIQLYNEGLIYRGKKLVNWDPALKTAISDVEVETREAQGHLWFIRYPINHSDSHVIVATTRPETMLGDTAIAIHPEDERYQHLIGKKVKLPLTDRLIPIITDPHVEPEFGTGCVKITPAHDFNDYEMGKRHQLPLINIFTADAHMNEAVPKAYQGLERYVARKRILADLEKNNLLEKVIDHKLSIPHGDRSGAVIEPYLTDQWFIKMTALAKPAIEAVKAGKLTFTPPNWSKIYLQWLENIQDWCISRQLWWGHRIPVWYDENNQIYVGHSETEIRKHHSLNENQLLTQDPDVLDTWFTSSLWPFATLGWPDTTEKIKQFYPTNVLVTGFDIIFFWVARMVMMGLKFTGDLPFHEVYITGLIRDRFGNKMSKTKGNVLDPINLIDGIELDDLIKKRTSGLMQPKMEESVIRATREEFPNGIAAHGTDALRFTFCALATTGRNINFDMGRIEGYRNFCNKLWNASRFVIINTEDKDIALNQPCEYSTIDLWIESQLQHVISKAYDHFKTYRFDLLAQLLYEFMWNTYCDWYLELAKCQLNRNDLKPEQSRATRITLLSILETFLRLIHPIMPFISEEIWQKVSPLIGKKNVSIMQAQYPQVDQSRIHPQVEQSIQWLKSVIIAIRTIRSEMNIPPSTKITAYFYKGTQQDQKYLIDHEPYLRLLAKLDVCQWVKDKSQLTATATEVIHNFEIHIPLKGLIDKQAELDRLDKTIAKIHKEMEKSAVKLNNPNYLKKAPEAVVTKARQHFQQAENTLKKLKQQYDKIKSI